MDWLRQYLRNLSNWKLLLALLVLMSTIVTAGIDFRNVGYPDWDLFRESPSLVESYGAKAAILALLGAAAMFIGFIPSGSSRKAKRADLVVRLTGALALAMTGLYWLLNATEGRPGPYLIAYIPTVVIYVCAVGNQQKWHTLEPERSWVGWRSGKLPECPVVASSPLDCLSLYLLPAL